MGLVPSGLANPSSSAIGFENCGDFNRFGPILVEICPCFDSILRVRLHRHTVCCVVVWFRSQRVGGWGWVVSAFWGGVACCVVLLGCVALLVVWCGFVAGGLVGCRSACRLSGSIMVSCINEDCR